MTVRRVSIFLPRSTPFYEGLLVQMRAGFEAAGMQTAGACRHLGPDDMADWCASERPDVIFEMNRPRADAPFIPTDIRHVVWVVDFNGRSLGHFEGSDITYLFGDSWAEDYPHAGFHRCFSPGASESDYPFAPCSHAVDVAFLGHMPNPWSPAERDRPLVGSGAMSFGELLPAFEQALRDNWDELCGADDYIDIAQRIVRERTGEVLQLDEPLRYDITCRVIRHLNRADLLDAVLRGTSSLELYGPDNWGRWPRYAPHYRGFLDGAAALCGAYHRASIQLHEGNGMHFRSVDAMCAGALLFFRQTAHDQKPGGIASQFAPHEEFVPFELADFSDVAKRYLSDRARSADIRRAAARAVRARHTWRHRGLELLADLAAL